MRPTPLLLAAGLLALAAFAAGSAHAEEMPVLHYQVKVRLDPSSHRLQAEVGVQHPPSSSFYLHPGLSVQQVEADGKEVGFHADSAADPLTMQARTAVTVETQNCQQLHVRYGGEISEVGNGVNMLTPELVELAYYSAWYPTFPGMINCTFETEVDAPTGFVVTTNGRLKEHREQGDRAITTWESYRPGFDMVLLASPNLHRIEAAVGDLRVEVYYSRLSEQSMKEIQDALVKGLMRLSDLYGPPTVSGVLRFVYSPRQGWGYSRIPLFVVPEAVMQEEMGNEYGEARALHGAFHEMSHFWWIEADASTPDDWINEGLAEYSAFRLSQERDGEAFARVLVEEYQQHARESETAAAIAETEGSSPDRYRNRYEKTTLMFLDAGKRFGQQSLDKTLRSFYARFAGTPKATTAAFLEEVKTRMGAEAEAFFREALYRKSEVEEPEGGK